MTEPPPPDVVIVGSPPPPGVCFTCGTATKLTHAHVPPSCVGNDGSMRPIVEATDPRTREGKGTLRVARGYREGGVRTKSQCAECNRALSRFDESLKPLWAAGRSLRDQVVKGGFRAGATTIIGIPDLQPGSIVRSLAGGATAMNAEIGQRWPALVDGLLSGEPVEPPGELLIGLGLHVGRVALATAGLDYYLPSPRGGRELLYTELSSIWFPPFSFVIREKERGRPDSRFDVSSWLREQAGDRREVALTLPTLTDDDVKPLFGLDPDLP